jgi:hypothetical protein
VLTPQAHVVLPGRTSDCQANIPPVAVLAAVLGAILGGLITAAFGAAADVRRHDQLVRERDASLEEWLITHNRKRIHRLNELRQLHAAAGALGSGAPAQALGKVNTIVLYKYRDELRQAEAFRLRVAADEGWQHGLVRRVTRKGLPELTRPRRAKPLIESWNEGTDHNALTWSLDDLLREIGSPP